VLWPHLLPALLAAWMLGWIFLPLFSGGGDETLRPEFFSMLPVPPRRIAWSSPAGDPATGNIYVFGACNELTALSNDGKVLWSRSLTEEFGAWTTHGGRTVSPIIEGDLVIVSTVTDGWGELAQRRHRYYAFDKKTGESVWISTPGGRPFDTTYSTPITTTIDGMRIMIAGAGDGTVNALKVSTGEPWTYAVASAEFQKRRAQSNTAIISHQKKIWIRARWVCCSECGSQGIIGEQILWACGISNCPASQ
jgi:outer membrane protein assembly factor BamB